ncbi:MAG: hypothetical protein DRO18_00495 [Thermoprotei archaeon]|nr:MAG: hypothetical protein DRO18_00495 [Thermoprotei archaeon]
MLSTTPLAALTAAITKLNKEKNTKILTIIGVARLALLIALLVPLARTLSTVGTAIAFLAANTLIMPIALKHLTNTGRTIATMWMLHIATATLLYLIPINEVVAAVTAIALSIAAMHLTKITTINELRNTLKTAVNTLLQRHRETPISKHP